MSHLERVKEIKSTQVILASKKSQFLYLRGRRRVGKSSLLFDLTQKISNSLLFTGIKDTSTEHTLQLFAKAWLKTTGDKTLVDLKKSVLDWPRAFEAVTEYLNKSDKKLTLFFDEIQWLAKQGNGFIGSLKNAWVIWERTNKVNIIVCGSSNKFFADHIGGEEKILRGMQTAASIWLQPFSFSEVRTKWLPTWNMQEVGIAYFMTGGIPYYLQRLDPEFGFIQGINRAFFTEHQNLLEEIDEIISLEFNSQGQETVKKILAVIGQDGSSQKQIVLKTGFSEGTVSKVTELLVKYRLLFPKIPAYRKKYQYEDVPRYYMKDFFLNFYHQLLLPYAEQIKGNEKGLLFPYQVGLSENGYHIPNFTGKAFELFVRQFLELNRGMDKHTTIHKKLKLLSPDYEVIDYWDKNVQIDLIVTSKADRICRVIECKWSGEYKKSWREELCKKNITLPDGFIRMNFLVLGGMHKGVVSGDSLDVEVCEIYLGDFL